MHFSTAFFLFFLQGASAPVGEFGLKLGTTNTLGEIGQNTSLGGGSLFCTSGGGSGTGRCHLANYYGLRIVTYNIIFR